MTLFAREVMPKLRHVNVDAPAAAPPAAPTTITAAR
jgi:hypothetical protein